MLTVPAVAIGDVVLFVSPLRGPDSTNRVLPAIVVAVADDGLPSLQVFADGLQSPTYHSRIAHAEAFLHQPNSWHEKK